MKVYESANIRNVALVGHHGAGKTMLSEAMLFASGATTRMGTIADGTTASDYHDSEHRREMSVFASLLHCERKGNKINLLDTPGYPDFMGEVVSSLRVADAALFVLNAVDPVQVGTETAWGYAQTENLPCLFAVNHFDKSGVEFDTVVGQIRERFGRAATVVQIPAGSGSRAVVDLLMMKQLTYPEGKASPEVGDIDASMLTRATELREALVEAVAENDETLLEHYFNEGTLSSEQLEQGLRAAVRRREMFPILITSATHNIGIARMMDIVIECCPAPTERDSLKHPDGSTHRCDPDGPAALFVYRIMSEPHVGEYAYFRVASGVIENGMDLENADTGHNERLGGVFGLNGRHRDAISRVYAGDLGAAVKLKDTHTNNTLRAKGAPFTIAPIQFPNPRYPAALPPLTAGEEDKMSTGLHKLVNEDPSLRIIHDTDLHQLILGGQGEMHIDIAKFRLKHRFGVEVALSVPKVSYRETIQKAARSQYRHKKQSGGAGQFADVSMIVEPLDGEYQAPADIKVRSTHEATTEWGAKLALVDAIVSGVIDMRRFLGAIQKGIMEAMRSGPIAGYPCGDVRVVIYDGKMHSVDSNEAAFKTAARHCFKQAMESATPVLLEPIFELEVMMPDEYTGDVISDLNGRRARIQGMAMEGSMQKISATAPELELLRYSTALRSITHGRGLHNAHFKHYEPMPRNVQDKVAAEARAAK